MNQQGRIVALTWFDVDNFFMLTQVIRLFYSIKKINAMEIHMLQLINMARVAIPRREYVMVFLFFYYPYRFY